MLTYHGVPAAVWAMAAAEDEYWPERFAAEGFIHTSPDPVSLADALNRHYAGDERTYLALVIDLDRVAAPWRIARRPGLDPGFPHIYGALNRSAVLDVLPVPRSPDGRFQPPGVCGEQQ
ncbi:MAG TPA: DUF952 domain-containing protein [Dehalococcoidia bacterium]|jgi:uncharacterized protein (DUF952 family)